MAALCLLDLDHLAKLGRLVDLPSAKDARQRLEDADNLFLRLGHAMKDALLGLRDDASSQIESAFQYAYAFVECGLRDVATGDAHASRHARLGAVRDG